jgi:hypothetical protein
MNKWQIILTAAIFLAADRQGAGQSDAPAAAATVSAQTGSPPPVVLPEPPYLQTTPVVIQPAPQAVPVVPPGSTAVPLPSHTPGSVFGPPLVSGPPAPASHSPAPLRPLAGVAPGGMVSPQFGLPPGPEATAGPPNPIVVPVADEDFAWEQILEVVRDYFSKVTREQRVRLSGETAMEGFIETAPQDGATWLEPHRRDSVGLFNRWESTFQTIRRRALVRVVPDPGGYLVEVIVEKELEHLPNPEQATAGAATFRNDGSLPSRRLEQVSHTRSSPRWIQLGRDPALEQRMLAEIHARLSGVHIGPASIFARP